MAKQEKLCLSDTWWQDNIQQQFHSAEQKDYMFIQIVSTVAKHGYYRATQQCCAWRKAVKRKYKKIADRLRKSVKDRELEEDDIPAHFSFFCQYRCSGEEHQPVQCICQIPYPEIPGQSFKKSKMRRLLYLPAGLIHLDTLAGLTLLHYCLTGLSWTLFSVLLSTACQIPLPLKSLTALADLSLGLQQTPW